MITRYLVDDLVDRIYPRHFNTQMHTYYCGLIFYVLVDTLNWKVRMRMSNDSALSWNELDAANAPSHWDQITPPPFGSGVFAALSMCVRGSIAWIAYAQAGTANIVFKPFDMVALTWGIETIVLAGTAPYFAGPASVGRVQTLFTAMDATAKLHVIYKDLENVGGDRQRPTYQTFDTVSSTWSAVQFLGDSAGHTFDCWPVQLLIDKFETVHFLLMRPTLTTGAHRLLHQSLNSIGVLSAAQTIVDEVGSLADPTFCLWDQAAPPCNQYLVGIYMRLISPWPDTVFTDNNHLGYLVAQVAEIPAWSDGEATYYNNPTNYGADSVAGSATNPATGCLIASPDYVYAVWPSYANYQYTMYVRRWDGSSWIGMAAVPSRNRILINHMLKTGIDPVLHGRLAMPRGAYVAGSGYGLLFMDEPGQNGHSKLWHLFFQSQEDPAPVRKLANYTTGGSGGLVGIGAAVPAGGVGLVLDG